MASRTIAAVAALVKWQGANERLRLPDDLQDPRQLFLRPALKVPDVPPAPVVEALAGANAVVAGGGDPLDRPGRLGAVVEVGHDLALDRRERPEAGQVLLLQHARDAHAGSEQ